MVLEMTHWKLPICGKAFCIRQTSQLSQFYRVPLAEACALLINAFEKLHPMNSGKSTTPATSNPIPVGVGWIYPTTQTFFITFFNLR